MPEPSEIPPGIAKFIETSSSFIPTPSRRAFEIRTTSQHVYNLAASHLFNTDVKSSEEVAKDEELMGKEHVENPSLIWRKLGFVFGGFATIDDSLQSLHRLLKRHDLDLLKSFIGQSEQVLSRLIKQAQTDHNVTWLNFEIDLRQWINSPSSRPKHNQYLNSSTIGFPFVLICQYCELLTLLNASSLSLSELNERCTFSAGFSLGLITSYIVSISSTQEELVEHALSSIQMAFWLGFRLTQQFQQVEIKRCNRLQLAISVENIPSLTNPVIKSGSVQVSGVNHAQIQLFLAKFNKKYGITDSYPFEICVVLQLNRITIGGIRYYMTHLISALIEEFPNAQLIEVPIDLPVHARSYFDGVSNLVMADLNRNQVHFSDNNVCHNYYCISSADGELCVPSTDTIHAIILAIAERVCRWDLVSASLLEQLKNADELEALLLIDIGPGVRSRDLMNNFKQIPNAEQGSCNYSDRLVLFPLAESVDTRTAVASFLRQQGFSTASGSGNSLDNSIAIVGMACRFPQALSVEEYFYNLLHRTNCISVIPKERWNHQQFLSDDDLDSPYKMKAQHLGVMEDIDMFDHKFFNINVRDASRMDPQHRVTMECCYLALENAGYVMNEGYRMGMSEFRIGIFVGTSGSDNYRKNMQAHLDAYLPQCGSRSFQAGRVSYFLKFSGPSIQVDTACSASMTCLHLACQAIDSKECDAAVVSGVLITTDPVEYAGLAAGGFFSATGMCKAFSAEADGYIRSDGVAAIVIRPYQEAVKNHDFIHSVIRATSANQSGQAQNILLPSKNQLISLMQQCLDKAHLTPSDIQYVEAHATGTQGGDPIETNAIIEVLGKKLQRAPFQSNPLYLGSHKAFIGHTEAASGLAGIIKVSMMLQHKLITPHFKLEPNKINPEILIHNVNTDVIIPTEKQPWTTPKVGMPRCAIVNSFGFSGANACCLLQEAPNLPLSVSTNSRKAPSEILLTLSAKHPDSLRGVIMRTIQYLTAVLENTKSDSNSAAQLRFLHSLSYTTTARRAHLSHRIAIVANDLTSLVQRLFSVLKDEPSIIKLLTNSFLPDSVPEFLLKKNEKHVYSSAGMVQSVLTSEHREASLPKRIVFVFSGQGSQYYKMCQELITFQPSFDISLRLCSEIFDQIHPNYFPSKLSIYTFLTHPDPASLLDDKQFQSTLFVQPLLFSIEYSLGNLFLEWGIRPDFMIGHSFGEIVAACLGNVLKLHDALFLIGHRAKLMNSCLAGSMLACNMTVSKLEAILISLNIKKADISIASHNSKDSIVIAGTDNNIQLIQDHVERTKTCRKSRLHVSHAFHSYLMGSIRNEFQSVADLIDYQPSAIPILCNVDGALRTQFNGDYWATQIVSTVKFHQSIELLKQLSQDEKFELIFVELSPTPVLSSYIRESQLTSILTLNKNSSDIETIYSAVAQLYCCCAGSDVSSRSLNINWNSFYRFQLESNLCQVVSLPSYVFNSKSLWLKLPWVLNDAAVQKIQNDASSGLLSAEAHICLPQIGQCEYRENRATRHFQLKFPIFDRKWRVDIQNHVVNNIPLFSIPLYISLITQLYTYVYQKDEIKPTNIVVEDVMFSEGFVWEETDNDPKNCRTILLELLPPPDTKSSIQNHERLLLFRASSIRPNNKNQPVSHATGSIYFGKSENSINENCKQSSFACIKKELDDTTNRQNNVRYETDEFYQVSSKVNTYYGPHFQSTKLFVCDKLGSTSWTKQIINTNQPYSCDPCCEIYPPYLDSFLQSYGVQAKFIEGVENPFVAIFVEKCTIQLDVFNRNSLENKVPFYTETTAKMNSSRRITCSTTGFNAEGECLMQLNGLVMVSTQTAHPVNRKKNVVAGVTASKPSHFKNTSSSTKGLILSIICGALECESSDINCDEDFSSIGIDSLLSIEIRRKIQNAMGIVLSYSLLFDYSTVNALTDHLLSLAPSTSQSTSDDFTSSSAKYDHNNQKGKEKNTGSSTKGLILSIICGALECEVCDINCDEDFSSIGIDSLLSIEIRRKIQNALDIVLSYSLLFDYSTVNSLTDHLLSLTPSTSQSTLNGCLSSSAKCDNKDEKGKEKNESPQSYRIKNNSPVSCHGSSNGDKLPIGNGEVVITNGATSLSNGKATKRELENYPKQNDYHAMQANHDNCHRPFERSAHLICMSNLTSTTLASNEPIIFMHTSPGRVGGYKELAKLFEPLKRPMYGIEAFGLEDNELSEHSMSVMLKSYADGIRRVYPNGGKLTIVGYSSSGILAYLFAIKLLKFQTPVFSIKSLILIDSGAPTDKRLRSLRFEFIDYVVDQVVLSSSTKTSKPEHRIVISNDTIERLRSVITAHLLSIRDYFYSDIPPLYKIDCSSVDNPSQSGDPQTYFVAHGAELGYEKYASSIIDKITLIRASDAQFFLENFDNYDHSLDWNLFLHSVLDSCSGNLSSSVSIRIHTVDSNHFNILESPQVQNVASLLIDNQLI